MVGGHTDQNKDFVEQQQELQQLSFVFFLLKTIASAKESLNKETMLQRKN